MNNTTSLTQQSTSLQPRWISPKRFEEEFEIKVSTQNKLRMAGKLPYSKFGKFIRYDRKKIDKLFEDAEVVS